MKQQQPLNTFPVGLHKQWTTHLKFDGSNDCCSADKFEECNDSVLDISVHELISQIAQTIAEKEELITQWGLPITIKANSFGISIESEIEFDY